MKVLLAVSSWVKGAQQGDHEASRATWAKEIPGVDIRFFMGDGTPVNQNEKVDTAWVSRPPQYLDKASHLESTDYRPLPDEVMLPVPDDFKHLPYKVRAIFAWALQHGYDFVFKVDTDTYVDVPRLMASGFEKWDYIGTEFCDEKFGSRASGGAGYWVNRKSLVLLSSSPVETCYEDNWTGSTLRAHGVSLHKDDRYIVNDRNNFEMGPRSNNNAITSHLGFSPEPYDNRNMHIAHMLRQTPAQNTPIQGVLLQQRETRPLRRLRRP